MTEKKTNTKDNEPMSSLTHFLGFLLSIAGLVLVIISAVKYGSPWHIVTFSIFGSSLVLLYLASTAYHLVPKSSKHKKTFQKIDFSFIFFLIAGTYTPVLLLAIKGAWGWSIFGVIWFVAIFGIAIQILKIKVPAWINVSLYLSMGWVIIFALPILFKSLEKESLFWLFSGGISYSIGVIFFAFDKIIPRTRWLGMHEVFHLFVMAGSFSHFWLMYKHLMFV